MYNCLYFAWADQRSLQCCIHNIEYYTGNHHICHVHVCTYSSRFCHLLLTFARVKCNKLVLPWFFLYSKGNRVSDQLLATITSDSFFLCSGKARPNSGSGLGKPRLGAKPPGLLSAHSNSLRRNRLKIIYYQQNVSIFEQIAGFSPEKQGIPGCMLVL